MSIIRDLYAKITSNPDLAGTFSFSDDCIVWDFSPYVRICIAQDCIEIFKRSKRRLQGVPIFHFHPDDEDLYDEVCRLLYARKHNGYTFNTAMHLRSLQRTKRRLPDKKEVAFRQILLPVCGIKRPILPVGRFFSKKIKVFVNK